MWDVFTARLYGDKEQQLPIWMVLPEWGVAPAIGDDNKPNYQMWRINHAPSGCAMGPYFFSRQDAVIGLFRLQQVAAFWQLARAVEGCSDIGNLPKPCGGAIHCRHKATQRGVGAYSYVAPV